MDLHTRKNDYLCPRCKVIVMIGIPHECDPSICRVCDGYKTDWRGSQCPDCKGTGKTIWKDDEGVKI
jgi:hypothetical protein